MNLRGIAVRQEKGIDIEAILKDYNSMMKKQTFLIVWRRLRTNSHRTEVSRRKEQTGLTCHTEAAFGKHGRANEAEEKREPRRRRGKIYRKNHFHRL